LEDIDCSRGVDGDIQNWIFYAFRDAYPPRQVKDIIHTFQSFVEDLVVQDIPFEDVDRKMRDIFTTTCEEVVDDVDFEVLMGSKVFCDVTSDKTGSASNQYPHIVLHLSSVAVQEFV